MPKLPEQLAHRVLGAAGFIEDLCPGDPFIQREANALRKAVSVGSPIIRRRLETLWDNANGRGTFDRLEHPDWGGKLGSLLVDLENIEDEKQGHRSEAPRVKRSETHEYFNAYLPKEVVRSLKIQAAEEGTSASALIERALSK